MRWQHLLGATAVGIFFCACGCTNLVTIYSEPPGAKCYIDGELRGETPIKTPVKSWALGWNRKIRLEKEGSGPFEGELPKKSQGHSLDLPWINDRLVSGQYGFLLRDADGKPVEMPPDWACNYEMLIQGRQPGIDAEIAVQRRRRNEKIHGRQLETAAEMAEQERREKIRQEPATLKAGRKPVELALAARWVQGSGSGEPAPGERKVHITPLLLGAGFSGGVSVRDRYGLRFGRDWIAGSMIGDDDYMELFVQAEAYWEAGTRF